MEIFGTNINMNGNEVIGLRPENVLSLPASPETGQIVMHTGLNRFYGWNGTTWIDLGAVNSGLAAQAANTVTSYRSNWQPEDEKVYDGYLLNGVITITREKDSVIETATGLTDLETDWTGRLSLTFT